MQQKRPSMQHSCPKLEFLCRHNQRFVGVQQTSSRPNPAFHVPSGFMNRLGVMVIITLSALLVIAARLIWPDVKVDTVTVAMILLAVLPCTSQRPITAALWCAPEWCEWWCQRARYWPSLTSLDSLIPLQKQRPSPVSDGRFVLGSCILP